MASPWEPRVIGFWRWIFYPSRRRIPNSDALFITFDDGPDPICTPRILDVLRERSATATFFIVAEKATAHPELCRRLIEEGHTIGNHSLDHGYRAFFAGYAQMRRWIERSEAVLRTLGFSPVGFRPPAGVRTPELHAALHDLGIPLVLWQRRFFDSVFPWSKGRALRSLSKTRAGDIVLLHDSHFPARLPLFLQTLSIYIESAHKKGLRVRALSQKECQNL